MGQGGAATTGGIARRQTGLTLGIEKSQETIEMFKPVKVTALQGYKIRILYTDGVEGEVDLSHLVGRGVFSLWNVPNAFESVGIGPSGEIKWSDEVELCPDSLYMEISGKSPEEVFPNLMTAPVHA